MKSRLLILTFFTLVFCRYTNAQVALEVKGQPFNDIAHADIEGYPYLENEWQAGTVLLENNKSINTAIKFDVYSNIVLFQDKSGQALELRNKFYGFTLKYADSKISSVSPIVFVNGCPAVAKQTEKTLYQLIADGKLKLLKYYKKDLHEDRDYDSSVITSTYRTFRFYYVLKDDKIKEIQLNRKTFAKLFEDHPAEVEAYFKANNIDFKSDADLQKLFNWYNALS